MTFEQAAALPQAGQLAVQGLFANGPLKPGQKILINGAGGGVGTIAIQLAKLQDVEVTGVDSARKLEMMRTIGFDHVIDYRKQDFTKNGRRYDLIVDTKTTRSAIRVRALTQSWRNIRNRRWRTGTTAVPVRDLRLVDSANHKQDRPPDPPEAEPGTWRT